MTAQEKELFLEYCEQAKSNAIHMEALSREIRELKESHHRDISDLKKENRAIYQIATSVEVMAARLGNIEEKVDETNRKVKETAVKVSEVENRPYRQSAQNLNAVKVAIYTSIATMIVSGIVSYFFFA